MNYSTRLFLLVATLVAVISCDQKGKSTSSYNICTTFDLTDSEISQYCADGLLVSPSFSWDDVCYYMSLADAMNSGYHGGFLLSTRVATNDATDEMAKFTSCTTTGGVLGSSGYMVYNQTTASPSRDIEYKLTGYSSATTGVVCAAVTNTLYNKRLKDNNLIAKGDYLKVIAEFYNGNTLVEKLEKYLIDYSTVTELKMSEDWDIWNMEEDAGNQNKSITGFDGVKFTIECSGEHIVPAFCIDNYTVFLKVEY
ncbi:MAG: DUF4465 domain-containing protein [Bacteroidales bacterium]|nr:DUF4465 domain-containing protein [Bacteroidales bacterium]